MLLVKLYDNLFGEFECITIVIYFHSAIEVRGEGYGSEPVLLIFPFSCILCLNCSLYGYCAIYIIDKLYDNYMWDLRNDFKNTASIH